MKAIKAAIITIISLVLVIMVIGLGYFLYNTLTLRNDYSQNINTDNTKAEVNNNVISEKNDETQIKKEFVLSEDLKGAIEVLALSYLDNEFDSDKINEEWKDYFISHYIKNARYSFSYLNQISEKNNGIIESDDISYMSYSLTGNNIDFSNYTQVDVNDSSSFMNTGRITDYKISYDSDLIIIDGTMDVFANPDMIDSSNAIHVVLKPNKDSCFDGYSIQYVKTEVINNNKTEDASTHTFTGYYMDVEMDGVYEFEVNTYSDDFVYENFISVDLNDLPDYKQLIEDNPGKVFEITFKGDDNSKVTPINMVVKGD
ncbi:MAG: hypothetical protein HUJ71_04140 [Pseudobutyrivibrio sp.]|nr:hypothetical protein [Pseudobutyrivibrio sp.]